MSLIGYSVFKAFAIQNGIDYHGVCSEAEYNEMVSLSGNLENYEADLHHFTSCAQFSIESVFHLVERLSVDEKVMVFTLGYCDGAIWACESSNIPMARLSYSPYDLDNPNANACDEELNSKFESDCLVIKNKFRKKLGLTALPIKAQLSTYLATICMYPSNFSKKSTAKHNGELIFLGFPEMNIAMDDSASSIVLDAEIVYTTGSAFSATTTEIGNFERLCLILNKSGLFIASNVAVRISNGKRENVIGRIDLRKALAGAELVLHHGGIGTIADAINVRVPQVILPRAFDQFYNARLIEEMSLGKTLDLAKFIKEDGDIEAVAELCREVIASGEEVENISLSIEQAFESNSTLDLLDLIHNS